jgi:hypothetical protein
MTLKYSDAVLDLNDCPPVSCVDASREAYRFAFEDLSDERHLLPPLKRKPKRALTWDHVRQCTGWALSFYVTEEDARNAYRIVVQTIGLAKVRKEVGTHLAHWPIRHGDGLLTDVDENGHFDLHEHSSVDFGGRITTIGALA